MNEKELTHKNNTKELAFDVKIDSYIYYQSVISFKYDPFCDSIFYFAKIELN